MELNAFLRRSTIVGIFLVPFLAFLVTPSMLFPFITGKNFVFRIIVEIIFACWVILALRDAQFRPKWSWLLGAFGIFVVIVGLADIFAVNPIKAFWSNFERMEGFLGIQHLFLYFLILSSVIKTKELWTKFWGTWVGTSVLMCFYSIFQLAGLAVINQGGVRVDGRLGNATYLAVYLMFAAFIATFLYLRTQNKKKALWWYLPTIFLQLFILYHTATRGAVLGLIGGVVLAVLIGLFAGKENAKFKKISISVLGAVILILVVFFAIRNTSFVKQSPVLQRFASISPAELKTQGRYFIWPMAIKGALEKPVLGWGQEGFNYIFNKYYNPKMYSQEQWFDRAHSTPLDWLVASGGLGLIAYVAIFFFALRLVWTSQNFNLPEKSLIIGLFGAYFFQNIFVFDNLFSYILFASLLSFIASSEGREIRFPEIFSRKSFQTIVSVIIVIFTAVAFWFWNVKPIEASRTLIKALVSMQTEPSMQTLDLYEKAINKSPLGRAEAREQLASAGSVFVNEKIPEDIQKRYVELARTEILKQIDEAPKDARFYAFLALYFRSIGDYPNAEITLKKALELSPRKQVTLMDLGTVQLLQKKFADALASFKSASELEPSFQDAKLLYGIAALYAGNNGLADQIISSLPVNYVINDDRLVGVLAELGRYSDLVAMFNGRISQGADTVQNNISLSIAYLRSGQRQKSIEVLQSYIQRYPEYKGQLEPYIEQIRSGKDF